MKWDVNIERTEVWNLRVTADTQEEAETIALERGVRCCSVIKDDLIDSEYEVVGSELAE